MSRTEQAALMEFLSRDNNIYAIYRPMIGFALATALRVGELTGLCWKDIDMEKNVIHIHRQLVYINLGDGCRFHFMDLKTDAGLRDIPITQEVQEYLEKQRENSNILEQNTQRVMIAGENDFVFINTQGKPYATNAVNHMLKNIVDAYNKQENTAADREDRAPNLLPHISAHILRHTACTRYAESGLDPKVLQYIMGHTDIAVTMNVYTHRTEMDQVQAKMDEAQKRGR